MSPDQQLLRPAGLPAVLFSEPEDAPERFWFWLRLVCARCFNPAGAGGATSIMMKCALTLLLTSSCIASSSAPEPPVPAASRTLKYLLEPPVYAEVVAARGESVTLPCILSTKPSQYKVKWTKVEVETVGRENVIVISSGHASRTYGQLGRRASLRKASVLDASLQLSRLELEDGGRYRCQLIHDLHDESVFIALRIEGVVFPYQSKNGRYKFTYAEAKRACAEQDGALASHQQLYRAWTEGLDWCNAGWLSDGTVQYPVIHPRPPCGVEASPGLRSYGSRDEEQNFDAFCFTSQTPGSVSFVPGSFSFQQAEDACRRRGARLALVGQLYAAWRFHKYDRCDGGWLKDGSVRFPISNPRRRCGGLPEAGVRSLGFPDQTAHVYGAYCYERPADEAPVMEARLLNSG